MIQGSLARLALMAGLLAAGVPSAWTAVNLELRGVTQPCDPRTVDVAIHAIASTQAPEPFAALEAILAWDPQVLELQGVSNAVTPPYTWLRSHFPNDTALDGLNTTWNDGNALYQALGNPGNAPIATPAGLLVAGMRFRVLKLGASTAITFTPLAGSYSATVVYDAAQANFPITGALSGAQLQLASRGDLNCDSKIDFQDINAFVLALGGEAGYKVQYPNCAWLNADVNCDGKVDFLDINTFVQLLTSQ